MDGDGDPCPGNKLCGYLLTVLTVPAVDTTSLVFLTPCRLFLDGATPKFSTPDGVVLSPVAKTTDGAAASSASSWKRRMRGMVNGSVSVIEQMHALLAHKCVKVGVRVLHVEIGEGGGSGWGRVVVLVDVYLPIALWSGWNFPKSASVAASLFRHLSCDWKKRNSMLAEGGMFFQNSLESKKNIWNLSDCHVLGCQLNCDVSDTSRKRRFELHEIFKSLPSVENRENSNSSRVNPADNSYLSGIWDLSDDILIIILSALGPKDLIRVASTCHHLKCLAVSIMPCMKLKLFPHQQAAVEWMLQRERNAEVLPHPLYKGFTTEDGFTFHVNTVSGEIVTGEGPTVRDFRGGLFCDEPGLGKTITALSLILKTQGIMADPPSGVEITWCTHNGEQRSGYYELSGDELTGHKTPSRKRVINQSFSEEQISLGSSSPMDYLDCSSSKRTRLLDTVKQISGFNGSCPDKEMKPLSAPCSHPAAHIVRCHRTLNRVKRNLYHSYEEPPGFGYKRKVGDSSSKRKHVSATSIYASLEKSCNVSCRMANENGSVYKETWVQCDNCRKWRKLMDTVPDAIAAWFCSMNTDPSHQSCRDPEQAWNKFESITYLPGFYAKGYLGEKERNVSFFVSVLKEHKRLINSRTKKALTWLAELSDDRLFQMETIGLDGPCLGLASMTGEGAAGYIRIFQAFGLIKRLEKGVLRWYYPKTLQNLAFDSAALRIALCRPLDSVRLYLSRATLVVVPANLVDHWKTQIEKHVKPGQLRLCIWTDNIKSHAHNRSSYAQNRKPSAHSLAWDYDVVLTTFNRLSAEWGPTKTSPLMQVHWLRVILDEGHTLGSSLNLTNKLQMAISLTASNRWLLTGTPMPNTPNSQLSHLQPMLKFLHDEVYGQNQKTWEAGILRPFDAKMEEGHSRLLQLLHRCMISARKVDLKTIPPCIKKVTFLNFTEEHAKSYNELVVTVRRNILMADWNDPSHVESLLNPKQWKFRSDTIMNVRLSCCVAGHINVQDVGDDLQETMDILVEKGLDPVSEEYALIKYCLQYGGNCLRCKEWCRLPVITPCRHLLCIDCVALDREKCPFPGCDWLYEMQTPEILTRPENPNPKWSVPKDLIELQPSYKQDDWDPDWESTTSSKVAYLLRRLKTLQEANIENGYSVDNSDAKNVKEQVCPLQMSFSHELLQQDCSGWRSESCKTAPEKVIIFSQFLEHIHVIEQQLTFAGIKFAGLYSPMPSSNKMKSLATFQHDTTCLALVMDGSAALGLDLSFVTHVFLMEPIWDRSMEEQVISRAHRMGATRPIHVETLAMRGTIEEQMLEFLQNANEYGRLLKEEFGKLNTAGVARPLRSLHDFAESNYLAHLSFVRTITISEKKKG